MTSVRQLRGPSHSALQVEEDPAFQRREWRWQRWGAVGLAVLVAVSLAGLLGERLTPLRAGAAYGILLLAFRIAGKRTVAQLTSFDLVLLLVIGDVVQPAIVGEDNRLSTAVVAVSTLIGLDIVLGFAKQRWVALDRLIDGLPLVLVDHGQVLDERLSREGIDLSEVLSAARKSHGLERLEDIRFAILERGGQISIVPARPPA